MKKISLLFCFAIICNIAIVSCRKPVIVESCTSKKIRYTIEGNYTGTLTITLNDNISGNTSLNNVTAPWKKEFYYGEDVTTISFEATGSGIGNQGQSLTANIFVNDQLVRSAYTTAGRDGSVTMPPISYRIR
jgi:hypothetical protein